MKTQKFTSIGVKAMKRYFSRLLSLVLVACVLFTGSLPALAVPLELSGDYLQDTTAAIATLRDALQFPNDSAERIAAQNDARKLINDYSARYRRQTALLKLPSFTTMRTALNSLAGHYSSYPNRPVPDKMKTRLEQEFKQIEASLQRGS
jgi:photosystem II Psb27 protein